ncbi:hypothetical protein GC207_12130 [bacterium]|nr:hypothetical protein [bacterium]
MESRKRKRWSLAIGLLAVLGIAGFLILSPEPEPTYNGKSLSEWLEIRARVYLGVTVKFTSEDLGQADADRAIRYIGTNALPDLLGWIAYQPSGWRLNVMTNLHRLPASIGRSPGLLKFVYKPVLRAELAKDGFAALGSTAAPAIPHLLQLMRSHNSPAVRQRALQAMVHIGQEAVPVMIGVVSNLSQPSDLWILAPLGRLDTNVVPLIPALVSQTQNTNLTIALGIIDFLRDLSQYPELAVPALKKSLEDPRPQIRSEAAHGLGQFSGRAKPALPALVKALRDPDDQVRAAATAAINSIYPPAIKWPIQE